jgi:HD-GYP domain-containing protein (c-di-GMP phosphodiesterase class II)
MGNGSARRQVLRLVEPLGALSLTADLGAGMPFEKGLRTCVIAAALATALDVGVNDRRAVYDAALLGSLGSAARDEHARGSREVGALLGAEVGLAKDALLALDEVFERFDGRGFPAGRAGDELTLAARVVHVAELAVMAHSEGGPEAAAGAVARGAGGQLDPELCEVFARRSDAIMAELDTDDVLARAAELEPAPQRIVSPAAIERVCSAFATFADLRGRLLLGHSHHVAALAARAGELCGCGPEASRELRLGGLLLDLGRVGVPREIWDRPGPLGQVERERMRLHTYWTERILERCYPLAPLAAAAGAHHERLDGSGYHRGSKAAELSASARLFAAADVFAALTEARPYRPPMSQSEAARVLCDEVQAGRLDGEAVGAVIEAAGLARRRVAWPNELTDREVEVLRVLVRGLTNREIADELVLSHRTVQHHLASIYVKIDLHTRAGAAVFAVEHGLVPAGAAA